MTGISLKDTIFLFNKPSAFIDTKGGGFLKKGFLLRKVEQQALLNKDREKGTLRSVEDEEPQASGQKDKNSQATTTKEDVSKIPPLEVMEPPPPLKKHTPGAARGEKSGGGAAKQARDSTHDFNTQSGGALRLPFLDSERRSESIFGIQSAPPLSSYISCLKRAHI